MTMDLLGLHHVTMITAHAQRTVDFYAGTLGLRLVKTTVNFDAPDVYHLYFGDEVGSPGSILTWFEFPDAAPGRPGAGMIHTLELGVGSADALGFWRRRLEGAGVGVAASDGADASLSFADPDGLALELSVAAPDEGEPLRAAHPEVPTEHAIVGLRGARAFSAFHGVSEGVFTELLGFAWLGDGRYRLDGAQRRFSWAYDAAPSTAGRQGAGSVHHIAFACRDDEQLPWRARIAEAGGYVTDVRDRDYFTSIYVREPRGVLLELATPSPGFAVDEDVEHLGEELRLPGQHEHLRARLEQTLTPIVNPRSAAEVRLGAR
jgi:glyoxalase family protein